MSILPSGSIPSRPRFSRLGAGCAALSVALLAALLLEACADDTPTAPAEENAPILAMMSDDGTKVVIEPHWLTLDTTGVSDTLTATVIDAEGDTISDATVTWESADTAIATVDTAGVVTSVEFGKTKVTATYDSVSSYATVEVAEPLTDREILEIFYEATGGEDWDEDENWLSDEDLDDWYGVRAWQGKVSNLSLDDNNLVGTIPPELGGLDELFGLVLRYNELSGPIPPELSKFEGLRDLFLAENAGITGRLPPELGYMKRIEYLTVTDTDLTGPVPLTFANLDLTSFYFDRDGVCIPAALQAWVDSIPQKEDRYQLCTDKIVIDPPWLYLEVHSPGDTARLTAAVINAEGDTVQDAEIAWASGDTAIATVDSTGLVTTVDYGAVNVTATSDSLADTARVEIVFKLSTRQVLDSLYRVTGGKNWTDTTNWLSDKPLSEWYGVETGDSSGEVVGLSLGNNNLTGSIPAVLAELDSLVTLDLGGNALGGKIPWDFRELQQLRHLRLNGNALEGLLPRSLGYMAGLRHLHIGDNELSGMVPRSFRNLELDTLYAVNSGVCVPPSLDEWFEGIEETDSAARCMASITIEVVDLPSLSFYAVGETGDLSATYVSAEGDTTYKVPATWTSGDTSVVSASAAERVTAVGDGETEVTATYDSTSGAITAVVDLPENDRDILEILHDRARGDGWTDATNWLSDEPLSEWAGVETDDSGRVVGLSLRNNNLRGPLHSSIGLLDRLVTLDLSRNWISGPILAEVGDLALLRDLTLSVNALAGDLSPALGTLDSLRSVNVAATSLSGLVPASFEDLELESFLVGGTDLCVPPSLSEWLDSIEETDDPPECASRVLVEPASLTFEASRDTATLSATVIDAEGEVVEDAEVTWKSGDTRVARVDTTGLVTARSSGVTNVIATYDSVTSATAEVAVRLSGGDRVALEALYRAMGGDDWEDNTNWMSDEPLGEWYGVDTWRSGRVKHLELQDNNVAGEIPAEIGLLDSLFSF
ncbi:MAG: Ig-like domain-containing protein [Gemmatimonadota bacterium]|nr:Ig-like domain-containing protein [Gemmatimonadota bacterium]